MATLLRRRAVAATATLLVALTAALGLAAPAQAEDGFRYWNYFHLEDGAWAFSQVGPADFTPVDGAVEAFRYGTSTATKGIEPRVDLAEVDFEAVCGTEEAEAGKKRVAMILDFGAEEADGEPPAPKADCAVVDEKATTQQILDEVATVRVENAMTCALDGYPPAGCGTPVKDAQIPDGEEPVAFALPADEADPAAAESDTASDTDDGGTSWWAVGGIAALVALIAAGGVLLSRRNRSA